jgi:hypothetical protein
MEINNFLMHLKSNEEIQFRNMTKKQYLLQEDLLIGNISEQYITALDWIMHLIDIYHHRFVLMHLEMY